MSNTEYFAFSCPHCHGQSNAADIAAILPDEILSLENARRNGRRQKPHAGPGRPTIARCPGCEQEMSTSELRDHRLGCVQTHLNQLKQLAIDVRLSPKDPDPYPNFRIWEVGASEVQFRKLSSMQHISVELRKVAEITVDDPSRIVHIRLYGRVTWDEVGQRWHFVSTRVGRPRTG